MKKHTLMIFLLTGSLCYAGCAKSSYAPSANGAQGSTSISLPKQGSYCTVQFRRDLLGAHGELPVAPTTSSINGAKVSVTGRFLRADAEWLILSEDDDHELWIPRSVVLLMRVDVSHISPQNQQHSADQSH